MRNRLARMLLIALLLVPLCGAVWLAGRFAYWFVSGVHRQAEERQRSLVYHPDPHALLAALRTIHQNAATYRQDPSWQNVPPGSFAYPDPADAGIPALVTQLEPSSIRVLDNGVRLEMGGGFHHYGVIGFVEGAEDNTVDDIVGSGRREIVSGLWYYTQDGVVPAPRE